MNTRPSRRSFLQTIPGIAAGSLALGRLGTLNAEQPRRLDPPKLTVIAGSPRERGTQYGTQFRDEIQAFLDNELYKPFVAKPAPKDQLLRYAGACAKSIRDYSPTIHDELEGIAQGAAIRLEEVVLINLHEELGHRRALPAIEHCTAVAVGPPDTSDGHTYVGQTWDWMPSVAGLSSVLHWKRMEGPSILAYGYPGMWVGAGMNSAGLALCWTSAGHGKESSGPRVGIPSYALLNHLLYQESLDDVVREVRRATCAGWFTFVLGDDQGNLLNIEGSPENLAIEKHRGRLARVAYGSRQMTGTAAGQTPKLHPRCEKMYSLLASKKSDRDTVEEYFQNPAHGICHGSTLDMMVFDTTRREAFVSRARSYGRQLKKFTFADTT